MILSLLLQAPDPNDYDNAWKYLVVVILFFAAPVIVFLWKENSKLTGKIQADTEKQRDDWKTRAETCSADFGKTSDALKVSNDTTVIIIGKIDKLSDAQEKLNEKLDRNWERFGVCMTRMERFQLAIEGMTGKQLPREGP